MRRASFYVKGVVLGSFLLAPNFLLGLEISWDGSGTPPFGTNSESWQNVENWAPAGSPFSVQRVPTDVDTATLSSPPNATVRLNADTAPINGLNISNGIDLFTQGHTLHVNDNGAATTVVSGANSVLDIALPVGRNQGFQSDRLEIGNEGFLNIKGDAQIDGNTSITGGGVLAVNGQNGNVQLDGDVTLTGAGSRLSARSGDIRFGANSMVNVGFGAELDIRKSDPWRITAGAEVRLAGGDAVIGANDFEVGAGGEGTLIIDGSSSELSTIFFDDENLTPIYTRTVIGHASQGNGVLRIINNGRYTSNSLLGNTTIQNTGTFEVVNGRVDMGHDLFVRGGVFRFSSGNFELNGNGFFVFAESQVEILPSLMIDGFDSYTLSGGSFVGTTMNFADSGRLDFEGGSLSFTSYGTDLLNEGGTLAPGDSIEQAGTNSVQIQGDYTQLETARLSIDIGGLGMGADYDFVDVTGNVAADGLLELSLLNGFTPSSTDTFVVMNSAGISGSFDNAGNGGRVFTMDGAGSFRINYGFASPFDPSQIVLTDFQPESNADFDNDGDVDGTDFLLIQRNNPSLIPLWQSQYGTNPLASPVAVPEPATSGMAFTMLFIAIVRSPSRPRKR